MVESYVGAYSTVVTSVLRVFVWEGIICSALQRLERRKQLYVSYKTRVTIYSKFNVKTLVINTRVVLNLVGLYTIILMTVLEIKAQYFHNCFLLTMTTIYSLNVRVTKKEFNLLRQGQESVNWCCLPYCYGYFNRPIARTFNWKKHY